VTKYLLVIFLSGFKKMGGTGAHKKRKNIFKNILPWVEKTWSHYVKPIVDSPIVHNIASGFGIPLDPIVHAIDGATGFISGVSRDQKKKRQQPKYQPQLEKELTIDDVLA
jgi:hypothetical protein